MLTDYDVRQQLAEYKRAEELGLTRAELRELEAARAAAELEDAHRARMNLCGETVDTVTCDTETQTYTFEFTNGRRLVVNGDTEYPTPFPHCHVE